MDAAVAFIFTVTRTFTQTHGTSLTLQLCLAVYFCDCAQQPNNCDTQYLAFLMPHVFFMKAERALEALSFGKCVGSQGQKRLTGFPLMFGG